MKAAAQHGQTFSKRSESLKYGSPIGVMAWRPARHMVTPKYARNSPSQSVKSVHAKRARPTVDIRGEDANAGALLFGALMLTAAWGMWKVRYWAVLGMQALLGLVIIVFSLFAMTAASVWALLLALAVVGSAGTLFWFMVKAMARIQMPTRDQ